MMTISALTPTSTPPMAMTLMKDNRRDPRRLRRYRHAIANSSRRTGGRYSGRIVGNRITSRMFGVSVRYMNSRSIPMPTPPVGGMPYSIARR